MMTQRGDSKGYEKYISLLGAITATRLSGQLRVHYAVGETDVVEFRAGNMVACEGNFDEFIWKSRALAISRYEWNETTLEKEHAWLTAFA